MSRKNLTQWRWDQLRSVGTSKVVQLTFLVPILGYFLLFGESFNEYLRLNFGPFEDSSSSVGINYWRIYFLYFGFCILALASFLFTVFCPDSIKQHGAAYEFVDKEEKTLSDYRIAVMRDLLERRNYETVRFERNYSEFDEVAQWVVIHHDNFTITEQDDESLNYAAKYLGRVKVHVRKLKNPNLMTEYFVMLKSTAPIARKWVSACYGVGFFLVAIPTIVVFGQVLVAAVKTFVRFVGDII